MARISLSLALALALSVQSIIANPIAAPAPTPAPSLDKRATTCTFSGSSGASLASKSKTSCSTIVLSNVAVPSGTTLDLTKLTTNTHVIFEGNTSFGYEEWAGPLVSISGTSITVTGASGSVLDGGGWRWWDGLGSNGGKTKPKFFYAHSLDSSTITGITIKDSPVQVFSIQSDSLTVSGVTINNKDGDTEGGHNTDAFDVSKSTDLIITGATVYNQDDCLAVGSGTNIQFTNGYCSGGHGLSIGSVASDAVVDTVTISNSQVVNSANGIRIKTDYEATGGSVTGVTFSGVTLSGITSYGIVIEQDYENGSPTGTPTGGIPITDLTVKNVVGTVTSSAYDVYILCASGACSGWTWSGNSVTGGKKDTACENVPSGASC